MSDIATPWIYVLQYKQHVTRRNVWDWARVSASTEDVAKRELL